MRQGEFRARFLAGAVLVFFLGVAAPNPGESAPAPRESNGTAGYVFPARFQGRGTFAVFLWDGTA